MGLLKKLAGQTALYGISSILGRMVNYLLLPLHTARLTVAEFGVVTEFYIYTAFLMVVYTCGMETTFFRLATRKSDTHNSAYQLTQSLVVSIALIASFLLLILSTWLENMVKTGLGPEFFVWMAIILFLDALASIPFAKLRIEQKAAKFALYKLIIILANLLLNIVFLWLLPWFARSFEWAAWGKLIAGISPVTWIILANLISSGLIFILFRRDFVHFKWSLSWAEAKSALQYGLPIMLMGLAGMTNELFGRLMLKYYLPENFYVGWSNQEILGLYGGCYKLSIFMALAIQSFRYAAEPFFFSQSTQAHSTREFARVMLWFVIVCSFILLAVSFNLSWIGDLFLRKSAYRMALKAVPLLLLANLFLGMYYNFSIWFKLTDRTIFGSYISWAGMLGTILLNLLLIPVAGFMGSAFATLLVYLGMSLVCYYLGQKYYPIPYPMRRITFYIIFALMLVTIDQWWLASGTATMYFFKLLLATLFLATVVWLEKLQPQEWLRAIHPRK